jgi:hypothetical protein
LDLKILTFQLEQCLTWFVGAWWDFDSAGVQGLNLRAAAWGHRFQICPQNEGEGFAAVFAVVAAAVVELGMTLLKEYLSLSSVPILDPLSMTL